MSTGKPWKLLFNAFQANTQSKLSHPETLASIVVENKEWRSNQVARAILHCSLIGRRTSLLS
jgi:hypothetical protein